MINTSTINQIPMASIIILESQPPPMRHPNNGLEIKKGKKKYSQTVDL